MSTTTRNSFVIEMTLSGVSAVNAGVRSVASTVTQTVNSATGFLTGMVGQLTALAGGVGALGSAFAGVKFNVMLKDTELGMAALLKAGSPDRFKTLDDSMKASADVLELLKQKAIETHGSFEDLSQGLTAITLQATAAGMSIKQQIDFMVLMSQTMRTLRVPTYQLNQESRALLMGQIDRNAMVARTLGITSADWKKASESGKLYEFLTSKMQPFSEASKVAQTQIPTLMSNIMDAYQQFLGKISEGTTESLRQLLVKIYSATQYLDAVAALIVDMKKDWKFAVDVMDLTMRAGWETMIGELSKLWKKLTEKDMVNSILAFIATLIEKLVNAFLLATQTVAQPFVAAIVWALDNIGVQIVKMFRWSFEAGANVAIQVINWIGSKMVTVFNGLFDPTSKLGMMLTAFANATGNPALVSLAQTGAGASWKDVGPYKMGAYDGKGTTFDKAMDDAKDGLDDTVGELRRVITEGANAFKFLLGKPIGNYGPSGNAVAQLQALIEKYDALAKGRKKALDPRLYETPGVKKQPEDIIRKSVDEANDALDRMRHELAMLEGDWTKTELEKRQKRLVLLTEESQQLDDIIEKLRTLANTETDPAAAETIRTRIDTFQKRKWQNDEALGKMGPSPDDITGQWRKAMTEIQDEWGAWAKQIAGHFKDVWKSSLSAVTDGITAAIMRTKSWGEAWRDIATAITTKVVNAIVDMGVQFVATQILMRGAAIATGAIMSALGIAQQAQNATTLATGATAGVGTSAAQGGWVGILIYMGVLAAALAAVAGMTGGFAGGGYTGDGPRYEVAGAVHRGEFVMSAPAVQAIGIQQLQSMHAAAITGQGQHTSQPVVNLSIVDRRGRAAELAKDPRTRHAFYDLGLL